jgi:hypothetical protein
LIAVLKLKIHDDSKVPDVPDFTAVLNGQVQGEIRTILCWQTGIPDTVSDLFRKTSLYAAAIISSNTANMDRNQPNMPWPPVELAAALNFTSDLKT